MGTVTPERPIRSGLRVGVAAAAVAAALWPAVEVLGPCPLCWLCWVAGGVVSAGFVLVGHRGVRAGLLAAGLTALAVFLGKVAVVTVDVGTVADKEFPTFLSRATYNRTAALAQSYDGIQLPALVAEFMVLQGFTTAPAPAAVTPAEIEEFQHGVGAQLTAFNRQRPSYSEWRRHRLEQVVPILREQMSIIGRLSMSFGPFDCLFLALGLATAYALVRRRGNVTDHPGSSPCTQSSTTRFE